VLPVITVFSRCFATGHTSTACPCLKVHYTTWWNTSK